MYCMYRQIIPAKTKRPYSIGIREKIFFFGYTINLEHGFHYYYHTDNRIFHRFRNKNNLYIFEEEYEIYYVDTLYHQASYRAIFCSSLGHTKIFGITIQAIIFNRKIQQKPHTWLSLIEREEKSMSRTIYSWFLSTRQKKRNVY